MMAPKRSVGRGEHAAHQEIADFGGREVDDAGEQAGIDQLLHRSAADAGGVEDQAFEVVLGELGRDLLHAGRRDAEHRQTDGGQAAVAAALLRRALGKPRLHHADHRVGAVGEHLRARSN